MKPIELLAIAVSVLAASACNESSAAQVGSDGGDGLRIINHAENLGAGFPFDGQLVEPRNPHEGDKAAIATGGKLFIEYNCIDCHGADGSGAMAPAFADGRWHFGGSAGADVGWSGWSPSRRRASASTRTPKVPCQCPSSRIPQTRSITSSWPAKGTCTLQARPGPAVHDPASTHATARVDPREVAAGAVPDRRREPVVRDQQGRLGGRGRAGREGERRQHERSCDGPHRPGSLAGRPSLKMASCPSPSCAPASGSSTPETGSS